MKGHMNVDADALAKSFCLTMESGQDKQPTTKRDLVMAVEVSLLIEAWQMHSITLCTQDLLLYPRKETLTVPTAMT